MNNYNIGIDVGSTTVKAVVMNDTSKFYNLHQVLLRLKSLERKRTEKNRENCIHNYRMEKKPVGNSWKSHIH